MNIAQRIVLVAGSLTMIAFFKGLGHWDTLSVIVANGVLIALATAIMYFAVAKKKSRPPESN